MSPFLMFLEIEVVLSYQQLAFSLLIGRPYFGLALRALQGLPIRHKYLAAAARHVSLKAASGLTMLEIGSWAGASAITLAQVILAHSCGGRLYCIDPWKPYFDEALDSGKHYAEMNSAAKSGAIFSLFKHNVTAAGVNSVVEPLQMSSLEALPRFQPASVDLVYIDGAHDYPSVLADVRQCKVLVRDGGIICGDDLEAQRHELAPQEHAAALASGQDAVERQPGYPPYHPGVTEAVAEQLGEVSVFEGFWLMKRVGDQWRALEVGNDEQDVPSHIKDAVALSGDTRPELVDVIGDYNIVHFKDRFIALHRSIGPIDISNELVGERGFPPLILVSQDIQLLRNELEISSK